MAKIFKGFNPDQKYTLLSKMGYSGPKDPELMEQFLAASPQAAAKMGEYSQKAQERLNKKPMQAAVGGVVRNPDPFGSRDSYSDRLADREFERGIVQPTPAQAPAPLQSEGGLTSTTVQPSTRNAGLSGVSTQAMPTQTAPAPQATSAIPQALTPQNITEALIRDPASLTVQPTPAQIQSSPAFEVPSLAGQTTAQPIIPVQGVTAATATAPVQTPASLIEAATAAPQVQAETARTQAAVGQVSQNAIAQAATGQLSPEAMAQAAQFDPNFLEKVTSGSLQVTEDQLATPAGQKAQAIQTQVAQANKIADAVAQTGVVSAEELPQPALIAESEMAQAEAITMAGLSPDATAVAAKLEKFTVDNGTLAAAMQGEVNALDTVQGQLSKLMQDFNDGTPAWAAGAIRGANAAMAARGLAGSSMAGAAIVQAAMESAIPIAAQDAQVFQQMNLQNLSNRQQVSLVNAAAQQGLQLQNLNNEQQAALQNSANAFALQSQNLSNMQSVVLANAQIKSALQGQNLSNMQQSNLATAARYAEQANINLNNRQQTALQNNMNGLNIELANLSSKQQAYVTNANLAASLQGQQISNQQQTAIANAARYAEAANITFTAQQQDQLHNSSLMQTIGIAELNTRQAATLQNAANLAQMDVANLNNRQQAAVQNAQSFLQMDLTNLDNTQQTALFRAQSNIQALFSDQAAENAAQQFNAASENQVNQFFADLKSTTGRFNADQMNAMNQFSAGEVNAAQKFSAQLEAARQQFNAANSLVVAQANAQWRQNIATINTAAQNDINMEAARTMNAMTAKAVDELWQKERDTMSYVFQAYENENERNLRILLADKNLESINNQLESEESSFKIATIAKLALGDW